MLQLGLQRKSAWPWGGCCDRRQICSSSYLETDKNVGRSRCPLIRDGRKRDKVVEAHFRSDKNVAKWPLKRSFEPFFPPRSVLIPPFC
jgi:hypothetical protein